MSISAFAVSARVLNFCLSVFYRCNSVLYVFDTCMPVIEDDNLVSAVLISTPFINVDKLLPVFNSNSSLTFILKLFVSNLKSNHLVVQSSVKTLLIFNPLQLKVIHNSLLALT
jgi:hypothetical protein